MVSWGFESGLFRQYEFCKRGGDEWAVRILSRISLHRIKAVAKPLKTAEKVASNPAKLVAGNAA